MVSSQSGLIHSASKQPKVFDPNIGKVVARMQNTKAWKEGKFPTSLRYLYLRDTKNQNKVTTIGYYWESPTLVKWQYAQCHNDGNKIKYHPIYQEEIKSVKDIFSRKIGRAIVEGRMNHPDHGPKSMEVQSKEEMLLKFNAILHPTREVRKMAERSLMNLFLKQTSEGIDGNK